MLNIIKMDLRHMFKTKAIWIILLIIFAFSMIAGFMTHNSLEYLEQTTGIEAALEQQSAAEVSVMEVGIPKDTTLQSISYFSSLREMISGYIMLVFVAIFAVLFANHDINSGFIKSISNQMGRRGNLCIAKVISGIIFVALTFVVFMGGTLISDCIFFNEVTFGGVSEFVPYILTQYLLHLAFFALMVFFTILVKNTALSMAIGIFLCAGLGELFYKFIDTIIGKTLPESLVKNFTINNYVLSGNIGSLAPGDNIVTPIIVACVFLLLTTALGYMILNKRDVK